MASRDQQHVPARAELATDTSAPRRFGATASEPALFAGARTGAVRFGVVFGGQGASWLPELRELHAAHLGVRALVRAATDRLKACAADPRSGPLATPAAGFELATWIENPAAAPGAHVLSSSIVSQPGIFLTQMARVAALAEGGLDLDGLASLASAATGHSQGVMSAVVVAEGHGSNGFVRRCAELAAYFYWQGYRMQEAFIASTLAPAVRQAAEAVGLGEPTPMAAINGPTTALLEDLLAKFHASVPGIGAIDLSLDNTCTRKVVSGPPASLVAFARFLAAAQEAEKDAFAKGLLGRRPFTFQWEFVAASAPFHSRYMKHAHATLGADLEREGIRFDPAQLKCAVLGHDGSDLRQCRDGAELRDALVRMQSVDRVQWGDVCRALRESHASRLTHVVDLGPGDAVAKLTAVNARGFGLAVLPAATTPGRRAALAATHEELPNAIDYRRFRPALVKDAAGRVRLDNAYTRFTGRAPVLLPGMTPTTSEAPIVAAAANAGYVAELAGGGQVTEKHLRLRARELAKLLEPGAGYVVNMLFLDPWLWNLQWKSERLVPRLRAEGAAIEGITVTAGVPELSEAKELLATCRAQGMRVVSFKPGTTQQIKRVLEIAAAHPDVTIGVQVEGGKAGGHHSWEDLRDLVRANYHAIREHPNVVLSVGGGLRTEADAYEWLTGEWSERLGLAPMPVDAVFLGTIAMAAKEACTSPRVKELLAKTQGTPDWVANGRTKGGVTSGRSQLDADIHYCDNAASRAGRLVDEVAGKREVVLARKAELVDALAKTAKPYFGELTEMTVAQVLRRIVELMSIGTGTEYEDGRWLDPTHRARVVDLARHFESRLAETAGTSIVRSARDLDDPEAFVARFVAAYPAAETRTLEQADAEHFVRRICQRPGKPVNFVPVIDEDVRRWFKSDSLWQSHHPKYAADEVFVIPGPEAVQGITRVDEPVGELLGRFERHAIERLQAAGEPVRETRDGAASPEAIAEAASRSGLHVVSLDGAIRGEARQAGSADAFVEALDPQGLARFVKAPGLVRDRAVVANTLAALLRVLPGDRWHAVLDRHGRLARLEVVRAEGHAIECVIDRNGTRRLAEVNLVHRLPVDANGRSREVRLALAFELDLAHEGRLPREITEGRGERLGDFYRKSMVGGGAAVPAGEWVRARFRVDAAFVREYALATADLSVAYVASERATLPLNAAFSAAFGAIFRATFVEGLAWDPSRLVHEDNAVRLCGAPVREGEELEVAARLVAWEPAKGGARLRTEAILSASGAERARVESTFFVAGESASFRFRAETRRHTLPADAALLELLAEKPWLVVEPGARLDPAHAHEIELSLSTRTHGEEARATVAGVVVAGGRTVACIAHEAAGDALDTAPARWFAHFAPARVDAVALPQPSPAHVEKALAPATLEAFAKASIDHNPLHRDPHAAALAGFDRPIVHGQWTAARTVAAAVTGFGGGDGARLRGIEVQFTDVVKPGDALELRARHTHMDRGQLVVELEARVTDGTEDEGRLALRGKVRLAPPKTAYVFPGQGVQVQGMGMDGYARSAAARRVWDEADRYCREELGFSLLRVVRENPVELRVGRELLRHEQGVLFLTQFTQVAMSVLAIAQVAELRETGCFQEDALFGGHSVGEYSAIGAITDLLPLTNVVELVYQRGLTMQNFVPRDAQGRSPYRMGVVRPNLARMGERDLATLVDELAAKTGLLLEVVNYNIKGRQYSVVGHIPALEALRDALAARATDAKKSPYVEVPGIDVPFHSKALRDGVDAFRRKLEKAVRADFDVAALVGRYLPNLVARPFSLDRSFADETVRCSDSPVLKALLARWDATGERPAELGRALFIEGLAYQFASPVRWIETQDLLAARGEAGVERVVEIGIGSAPTQANMLRATLALDPARIDPPLVQHVELDRRSVFHAYDAEQDAAPVAAPGAPAAAPVAAPAPVAKAAPAASAGPIADAPLTVRDSLLTLLALKARVRVDEIRADETVEALCGGNSSKRNQVLADLGAEFSLGAIDGAHEQPLAKLTETVEKSVNGKYRSQGAWLRAQVTQALKPTGLTTKDVLATCAARGLGEGRSLAVLNRVALWARTGDSTRSGALSAVAPPKAGDRGAANAWVDACIAKYASDEGISLGGAQAASGGATVDAAALEQLLGRYFGVGGAFLETLRFAQAALGQDVWATLEAKPVETEDAERLARYAAEHGEAYEKAIRPAFAAEKAVVFGSAWAWAKRDALDLFHALMANRATEAQVAETAALLRRAADDAAARTVAQLRDRAARAGREDVARAFARIAASLDPKAAPLATSEARPVKPTVEITQDGVLKTGELAREEGGADAAAQALISYAVVTPHDGDSSEAQRAFAESMIALAEGRVSFAGRTALVTGASDRSIAIEVVKLLLTGGARVVVTTSSHSPERVRFYRRLFQRYGARGAELVLVPFNQGSRQDVQKLVAWLTTAETTTVGGKTKVVKDAWVVDLLVPFGALGEEGTLSELSDRSLATLRVLLFGVEALVAELANAAAKAHQREVRTHVLLPLSPNHGQFGNDGLYGETKAALEAMLHRWKSESAAWAQHASIVGARIGWVRGTGLMNVNDAIAPGLEERSGVRTFASAEMGLMLAACCTDEVRALAEKEPLVADLTGGMAQVKDLGAVSRELRTSLLAQVALRRRVKALKDDEAQALGMRDEKPVAIQPSARLAKHFAFPRLPSKARRDALADLRHLDLSKVAVIVGIGEVGPWGSARTRWSYERSGELSVEACVELAWITGKIRFERSKDHVGWVDAASGEAIAEHDVKARYEAALFEASGIRLVEPKLHGFDPRHMTVWADVALDRELVFPVPSRAEGEAYVEAAGATHDPSRAMLVFDPAKDGWFVVRPKGSTIKVARAAKLDRYAAGQVPTGWDATRYGVPKAIVEQVDRTTLFNLVATVEAFLSAGLEPEELYEYLHPSHVGNTQGSGIGGMQKLKRLYLDAPLDRPRQNDSLQETLINVTAAWIVQSLVGSYGPMLHPVGACATAAVSVEAALDKLATGQAGFVVAGGFDDYGEEGALGFNDMAATADTTDMLARGIPVRDLSRPNDRRRRGFVEAQGGGTVLVARADLAVKMGLPIHAAVALARSHGDGIHRSIPAPGPGVMSAASERPARDGEQSGAQLADLNARVASFEKAREKVEQVRAVLGDDAADRLLAQERRYWFHEFHAGDERLSPMRRALATFGLGADDVAAVWKHDTSTEANDPNENQAYDRIFRWLGRSAGNPIVVVSQKSITGHSKGGAAAWQLAGLCQGLAEGLIPGNPCLDDPDPAMRKYETMAFSDRAIRTAEHAFEAGCVTSLGFGHVGAIVVLVHPDRVLAALDDEAFAAYAAKRGEREQATLKKHLAILEGAQPAVRMRTDKAFVATQPAHAGLDPEHAALLDASSRRLETNGPIVAGGRTRP